MPSPHLTTSITQLVQSLDLSFSQAAEALAEASQDFGRIIQGNAQVVVQPRDLDQVVQLIQLANQHGCSVTVRGSGCSQSGQSISPGGIALEMSRLDQIDQLDRTQQQIQCGAGTTWRQLMMALAPQGFLPCSMPMNLNVGGTLSAAGFGPSSHRYGPTIATVKGVEVVTGAGDPLVCTSSEQCDGFTATLGGLGHCAIITSATLTVRPFKPHVRTYYLLYEDLNQWLTDQQYLAQSQQVDYLEGFCSASIQGLHKTPQGRSPLRYWLYGLHVGVEFADNRPPIAEDVLQGLHNYRLLHTEDDLTIAYLARYDLRYQMMQKSGAWQRPHPWFDCLLPVSSLDKVIPHILELLPAYFGDGHRVIMLADCPTPPLLSKPDAAAIALFAILPVEIPPPFLPEALDALQLAHDFVIQMGGKRYLSGWLGNMTSQVWETHYGPQYNNWQQQKRLLDPHQVLRSMLLP
jgi:cytokinin dehydrogenase